MSHVKAVRRGIKTNIKGCFACIHQLPYLFFGKKDECQIPVLPPLFTAGSRRLPLQVRLFYIRPAVRSYTSDTLRKITVALRHSLLSHDLGAKLRDVFGKASPAPLICRPLSVGSSFPYFFPSQFLENDSFHYKLPLM